MTIEMNSIVNYISLQGIKRMQTKGGEAYFFWKVPFINQHISFINTSFINQHIPAIKTIQNFPNNFKCYKSNIIHNVYIHSNQ